MNRVLRTTFLALLLLLIAFSAKAQTPGDLAAGLTPYQSFHGGDFDSVNLSNGNVVVHIPLVSYPQRGGKLSLDYEFFINSKWIQDREICPPEAACYFAWGVPLSTPVATYEGILDTQALFFAAKTHEVSKDDELDDFAIVTSDSAVHPLGANGSNSEVSLDVTGYFANANTATLPTVLMDRNGIRYPQPPSDIMREDPNGNQILQNATTFVVTDTIGRSIPWHVSTTTFSGCAGPLTVTSAFLWTIPGPSGGTIQFKVCSVEVPVNIPAGAGEANSGAASFSESMVQTIILPNNTTWIFQYSDRNSGDPSTVNYGMLTQITMPTGGTISYTYATIEGTPNSWTRWVTSRTVNANDGTGNHTYTYSYGSGTLVTDPMGNSVAHSFTEIGSNPGYVYETETQYYQGSSTLLKTVNTVYNASDGSGCKGVNSNIPFAQPFDVYPTSVTTTWPNGQVSQITMTDDSLAMGGTCSYGNLLTKSEYDYGSGAPGALLRMTTNQYEAFINSTYLTNNLLTLPSSVQITDGSGTQVSSTTYGYDAGTLASSGITAQRDSAPADGANRGNQTSITRALIAGTGATEDNVPLPVGCGPPPPPNPPPPSGGGTSGPITSTATYFDTGEVQTSTDPKGNPTTFAYSATYQGAYPTTVTNALSQSTTYAYDFNTGLLTSTTDPNGQITRFTYDNLWRIATATYPDGGSSTITHQETTFPFTATLTKKITSSMNYVTTNTFDGLGRVSESLLTDPERNVETVTTYDSDGRKASVSNPYRFTSDPTYGLTQFQYDALNRTTQVTQPDGSLVKTSYSGNTTTVTDEAGKKRESVADGLGRLTEVFEDPSGSDYQTLYTYDALSNLLTVVQNGSRNRTFAYDSLSRLTSSTNPESGTMTYTYDADGNVVTKKDARGITTTNSYDQLNRLLQKSYSDGTPTATYVYDVSSTNGVSIANPIGRLITSEIPSLNYGVLNSYDSMGRIVEQWQYPPLNGEDAFVMDYGYDLAGDMTSYTNGEGVSFTQTFDSAARVTQVTSSLNDAQHPATLVSGVQYAPNGSINQLTYGNKLTESSVYNPRFQICRDNVNSSGTVFTSYSACGSSSMPTGNVLDLQNNWSGGSGDNGNLTATGAAGALTYNRAYTYDSLNRLSTMTDSYTGATCGGASWTYDAWGNRLGQTATKGSCLAPQFTFDANNQIIYPTGFTYDAAGNMTHDASHSYTFDAENRITAVDGGTTATYSYDAMGRRVEKTAAGVTTDYLYNLSGAVTAEQAKGLAWGPGYVYLNGSLIAQYGNSTTYFVHHDHLGTTRLMTNVNGSVYDSMDYMPFGEQIAGGSGTNHKFTGKERDTESGLDNFGARYDASSMGRFMTPDPLYIEAHRLVDPQRLNLYAYARNNPVTLSDPTGLDVTLKCDTKANCAQAVKDFNSRKGAQFQVELGKDGKLQVVKGSVANGIGGAEGKLLGAINDSSNHATINVSGNTGQSEFGTHDSKGVNSVDLGNLSKMDAASNAGGLNSGDALAHEAMDAYYSLSMGEEAADQAAAGLYPGLYGPTGNQNSLNQFGTAVVGSTFNQAISNGSGTERVTIQYITPIPAIDLFGKSAGARGDMAHDAGSRVTGVTFVQPKQQ
jgi:RHS repeat-associated protein